MKSFIHRFFSEFFSPSAWNDLDTALIGSAFNDLGVRTLWLKMCFEEIRRINQEADRRILSEDLRGIGDLCARRRAIQDMLEMVHSARRQVAQPTASHNPRPSIVNLDLDRVTG